MVSALEVERRALRERRAALPQNHLGAFVPRYLLTLTPITLVAVVAVVRPAAWSWLLVAAVAGFTQNAMAILMHEGSHGFLHPRRTVNDLIANVLVCLPIFNTVQGYRSPHLDHHRQCCDDGDPYFELYGPYDHKHQLISGFVRDVLGVTAVRAFVLRYVRPRGGTTRLPGYVVPAFVAVHAAIFWLLVTITGQWWGYLLWIVPLMTVPIAINRLRTFVEHHAGLDGREASRGVRPNLAEYLMVAPYGYAHHFEHHLMPEIPYYQLAWAHSVFRADGVEFQPEQFASRGYVRTFFSLFADLR